MLIQLYSAVDRPIEYCNQMAAVTIHTAVAPSGECYEVNAGVVCLQLCDLHLSALEVRFSR